MQNQESENNWKTKECGYLNDKIKNLEAALEKAKLNEFSEKYKIITNANNLNNHFNNKNNDNKFSTSEFNDLVENTAKTNQNLNPKIDYKSYQNEQSKITFENESGREECNCNCSIYQETYFFKLLNCYFNFKYIKISK